MTLNVEMKLLTILDMRPLQGILDTRDPATAAYQESLRAEPEAESESGRTSSQPPRNGMGAHETMTKTATRYTYKACQYEDFRFREAAGSAHRAQVEGRDSSVFCATCYE